MDDLAKNKTPVYESALQAYQTTIEGKNFSTKEFKNQAYVVVRGKKDDADFVRALQSLGFELPGPMSITKNDKGIMIWISPDEYLLIMDEAKKIPFIEQSNQAFSSLFAAVIDNSGGYAQLELSGAKHLDVLAKLSAYPFADLEKKKVISSYLGKAPAIIIRLKKDAIIVLVRFSFADYLWRLLDSASGEYCG